MENRTTIQVSDELRKELKTLAARRDISYQELLSDMISIFKELDKDKTIISIPSGLADKLKANIRNDFRNLSDYVAFLLRLLLYEKTVKGKVGNEDKIKKRLKELGYM